MKQQNKIPSMDGLSKKDLEELKLKMEIEKAHFDIQEKKKSWVFKNSGILIPSIIALATILTGVFTGYFSAVATKLENQKHDIEDSIISFKQKKDNLNRANLSLSESNDHLKENLIQLRQLTQGLETKNKLYQDSTFIVRSELVEIKDQTEELKKEKNFVLYQEYLSLLKKFPQVNNNFVEILINRIKSQNDQISNRIIDNLNQNLSLSEYRAISAYILFWGTGNIRYLDIINNEIDALSKLSIKIGSDTLPKVCGTLASTLESPKWRAAEKKRFSNSILRSLKNNNCLTPFNNELLYIPSLYKLQENDSYSWTDSDFWFDYIKLNLYCLLNKTNQPKLSDTSENAIRIYDSINSFYITKKKNFLNNLRITCPQSLFCFYTKYSSAYPGLSVYRKETTTEDEEKTLVRLISTNFSYYMIEDVHLNKLYRETFSILNDKFENFDLSTGDVNEILTTMKTVYRNFYQEKEIELEKWLDPRLKYFSSDKSGFFEKLKNDLLY